MSILNNYVTGPILGFAILLYRQNRFVLQNLFMLRTDETVNIAPYDGANERQ